MPSASCEWLCSSESLSESASCSASPRCLVVDLPSISLASQLHDFFRARIAPCTAYPDICVPVPSLAVSPFLLIRHLARSRPAGDIRFVAVNASISSALPRPLWEATYVRRGRPLSRTRWRPRRRRRLRSRTHARRPARRGCARRSALDISEMDAVPVGRTATGRPRRW